MRNFSVLGMLVVLFLFIGQLTANNPVSSPNPEQKNILVLVTGTHPSEKCPGGTPEGMKMMSDMLSEENAKKAGVKIIGSYATCEAPTTPGIHEVYFIIEAPTVQAVTSFLSPLEIKARQVWDMREQIKKMMK